MPLDKGGAEHILHVAGKKAAVVDAVGRSIDFRVGNGLGNIFNADYLFGPAGDELGDGSRAGVEVVDDFLSGQGGEFAGYAIQALRLQGIGLVEGLRPDLETRPSIVS